MTSRRTELIAAILTCTLMALPCTAQMANAVGNAGAASDTSATQLTDSNLTNIFNIDGDVSNVTFSLLAGEFNASLDGLLAIDIGDPTLPTPGREYVGVRVRRALLIATDWDQDVNIFPDPYVMFLNVDENSTGWFHRPSGTIWFTLYLRDAAHGPIVPMPLFLGGTLTNAELHIAGSNPETPDANMFVDITAHKTTHRPSIKFSTEIGFPVMDTAGSTRWVSDGDLLSNRQCVVMSNHELLANFGIMPPTPDLGLDAATLTNFRPVLFSTEESAWSETMGQWVGEGDLLCSTGRIVRTNQELIAAFGPVSSVTGVGLDAIHVPTAPYPSTSAVNCCPHLLFSVERDFYSSVLDRWVRHGDLICEGGCIFRTNRQLLVNFHPIAYGCEDEADCQEYGPCGTAELSQVGLTDCVSTSEDALCIDFGLDAVYLTENGEIWFSVEVGFLDANIGWVSDGDILSTRGYVVARNRRLVDVCDPLVDCANFGLDALDWIRRPIPIASDDSADNIIEASR